MTIFPVLSRLKGLGLIFGVLVTATVSTLAAAPGDKVFTVANYPVEAEAANAVAAKDKALAEGQDAAFRSLLKRLVPVTAYNQLARLKGMSTADLVDGVRSRSEQNSPTRYIAAFDFAFQADAVREVLSREGVPFVAEQAPEVVVIPLMRQSGAGATPAPSFTPATPAWSNAWKGLDLENSVSPGRLSVLKPEIHPDTVAMMLSGDGSADRIVEGEYKTALVVLAVAEIDAATKQVHVTLAGHDAAGPFSWKRSYRASDGDTGYAMELASVVSLGVLEGRWKALKSGGTGVGGFGQDVEIDVVFESQDQWNDIRGRVLDLQGVDDVRVGTISARNAQMGLKYPGGGPALASTLAQQGLTLSQTGGQWQLRAAY
ncbi:MAG: DUF2066 domain-containing protein [Hyphomicrobium sp.]